MREIGNLTANTDWGKELSEVPQPSPYFLSPVLPSCLSGKHSSAFCFPDQCQKDWTLLQCQVLDETAQGGIKSASLKVFTCVDVMFKDMV